MFSSILSSDILTLLSPAEKDQIYDTAFFFFLSHDFADFSTINADYF